MKTIVGRALAPVLLSPEGVACDRGPDLNLLKECLHSFFYDLGVPSDCARNRLVYALWKILVCEVGLRACDFIAQGGSHFPIGVLMRQWPFAFLGGVAEDCGPGFVMSREVLRGSQVTVALT